jgi:hypothetical protein
MSCELEACNWEEDALVGLSPFNKLGFLMAQDRRKGRY